MKTIAPGKDKKAQVTALIGSAYTEADARSRLDTELNELIAIGNACNIRHFEGDKLPLPDDAFVDYLFSRCYSVVYVLLYKAGRVKH